jgi:aconitate hydratase
VYYSLAALARQGVGHVERLPLTVKVLLENALRLCARGLATPADVLALASWDPAAPAGREVPFLPARVLIQDLIGVPAVVDLAAMRAALARLGADPARVQPVVPADLVIDHSVQVDYFGARTALGRNVALEYARNHERYGLLRWAQQAFRDFTVVPPSTGIVHQVNLEHLAQVVQVRLDDGELLAYPDTLVGMDSHTPMVNGLGVLGWGVGGIEAEAVMLGQPLSLPRPRVLGVELHGELRAGVTATDLVLTLTQILRRRGVVDTFVEFFGDGLRGLPVPDRATLANMAPEYGATAALFPIDDQTLDYLRLSARPESHIQLVERYARVQGLFRTDGAPPPVLSDRLSLDLSAVEPSVAGPERPQDRVRLSGVRESFWRAASSPAPPGAPSDARAAQPLAAAADLTPWPPLPRGEGGRGPTRILSGAAASGVVTQSRPGLTPLVEGLGDGAVVIAAITSCTNTSNPGVMVAAGLLARNAVERGLGPRPWVKTSLAPGSRVVADYLHAAGLLPYLEALGFHVVGYGCTTCIGNSGQALATDAVTRTVRERGLRVAAVLSGNRNFPGRIHPLVRAQYLASPPLVVAYALAGSVEVDLTKEPIGTDRYGAAVFLRDLWPSPEEVQRVIGATVTPERFRRVYADVRTGDARWRALPAPEGAVYAWDAASTYVQEPPFFAGMAPAAEPAADIHGARVLVMLGDSVTTDAISPAGAIPTDGPAGRYLIERGVAPGDFNSFGARRGNHEVMVRGTFGGIHLRNELVPGRVGDWTRHHPTGETLRIFDASRRYLAAGTPLLVLAGREYGTGSSRDWAAKGPLLLGVKLVLAESFERIHRANLAGMGILPLQFMPGDSRHTLGLDGTETFSIAGVAQGLTPRQEVTVVARRAHGTARTFRAVARVDTAAEAEYLRHGGILRAAVRRLLQGSVR